jgi:hypothetical protein
MKRFGVALAIVALVAPAALGLSSGTASANSSASINIQNSAQLVGGGVDVSVIYSCAPAGSDTGGTVSVKVSQGSSTALGAAAATCDDKSHNTTVQAIAPRVLFIQGAANAFGTVSNSDGSAQASEYAEITIK